MLHFGSLSVVRRLLYYNDRAHCLRVPSSLFHLGTIFHLPRRHGDSAGRLVRHGHVGRQAAKSGDAATWRMRRDDLMEAAARRHDNARRRDDLDSGPDFLGLIWAADGQWLRIWAAHRYAGSAARQLGSLAASVRGDSTVARWHSGGPTAVRRRVGGASAAAARRRLGTSARLDDCSAATRRRRRRLGGGFAAARRRLGGGFAAAAAWRQRLGGGSTSAPARQRLVVVGMSAAACRRIGGSEDRRRRRRIGGGSAAAACSRLGGDSTADCQRPVADSAATRRLVGGGSSVAAHRRRPGAAR